LLIAIISCQLSFLYPASCILAEVRTSENYMILDDSINPGSGTGSSANFYEEGTFGETGAGPAWSDNYGIWGGFHYYGGSEVPPMLYFSISDDSVDLGTLVPTQVKYGTAAFEAASNATHGYVIYAEGDGLESGSNVIDSMTTPATSSPGTEQFGMNLVANTNPSVGANPSGGTGVAGTGYGTTNNFKFVSGDLFAETTAPDEDVTYFTMSIIANISNETPPGIYQAVTTLTATGRY